MDFDDGDKQKGISVRDPLLELGMPPLRKPQAVQVGQLCHAPFQGSDMVWPGKISKVNKNGTVDVEFDDGDKEKGIR